MLKNEQTDPLDHVKRLKFKDQAIWFLNVTSFGLDNESCEQVWQLHKKCAELDRRGEDGTELDEFNAHRLLEYSNQAKTVKELRHFLAQFYSLHDSNHSVSLVELLIFIFRVDVVKISNLGTEENTIALQEAVAGLKVLKATLDYAITEANKAKQRAEDSKKAEEVAANEEARFLKAASDAELAKEALISAELEGKVHLDRLHDEEKRHDKQKKDLSAIILNSDFGIVKRNKAKAELSILESGDKTPLRKAKIDQEASLVKLKKARTNAELAASNAQAMATTAERSKIIAHKAVKEALESSKLSEQSIPILLQALINAYTILEKLEQECDKQNGTVFYMNREIEEAEKFLPKHKIAAMRALKKGDNTHSCSKPKSKTVEELKRMKFEIFKDRT